MLLWMASCDDDDDDDGAAGFDQIKGCIEENYASYLSMLAKIAIIWFSKRC